ncbi:hypothetical protein L7F22_048914 [Adiantum nelumboides]|nr:hypothetical protein [Adiantum nelumboides]
MEGAFSSSSLVTSSGSVCFTKLEDLKKCDKQYLHSVQVCMKETVLLEYNENVSGLFEQDSFVDTMNELDAIVKSSLHLENEVVVVCSMEMYQAIEAFKEAKSSREEIGPEVHVETKYKNVAKKVKPVASPLPPNNNKKIEQASLQPSLRNPNIIGHKFTEESFKELHEGFLTQAEKKCFEEMLAKHGKAFLFEPHEIGCVDPSIVAPMVICTIPHVPWNLRPIPIPKAHLPKLVELLNEKIKMGILEPSCAPYSNRSAHLTSSLGNDGENGLGRFEVSTKCPKHTKVEKEEEGKDGSDDEDDDNKENDDNDHDDKENEGLPRLKPLAQKSNEEQGQDM